jgi:hypothetical protein
MAAVVAVATAAAVLVSLQAPLRTVLLVEFP